MYIQDALSEYHEQVHAQVGTAAGAAEYRGQLREHLQHLSTVRISKCQKIIIMIENWKKNSLKGFAILIMHPYSTFGQDIDKLFLLPLPDNLIF